MGKAYGKMSRGSQLQASKNLLIVELYQTQDLSSNELWSYMQNIVYWGSSLQVHHQGFDFRGWLCNHPLTQGKVDMENKSS